jgi:hypothetical protein
MENARGVQRMLVGKPDVGGYWGELILDGKIIM